jgi:hypothetical protein
MSINFQKIGPVIAACVTTGGMIFQMGKQSEKLDIMCIKVEAQEKKDIFNSGKVCDIYNKVNILQNDVTNIKEDITEIKTYIKNK